MNVRDLRKLALAVVAAIAIAGVPAFAQRETSPAIPAQEDVPIALLVDVTSGQVLYSRNASRRFVPASITKVMTMFLAFELIESGRLDPRETLTVPTDVAKEWGGKGSSMFLQQGDRVQLADVLTGIANVSANDGAVLLATYSAGSVAAWTAQMNAKARSIGMEQSHFGTPNGWPDEGYTFTSASDLVRLADTMIRRHPTKFATFIGQKGFRYRDITQSNHDPLIGRVKGADGIKTGYTNEAGYGYLGTVKRNGQRLVMVVAGVSGGAARASAARSFIEWGFTAFDRQRLFAKGESVGLARVQDGSARTVELVTDRPIAVNVPKGKSAQIRMEIAYDGPLRAPITAGAPVAMLEITAPDMEPARIPLMAKSTIEKAGPFARVFNAVAGWLG